MAGLTASERRFLETWVRTDVEAEQREAYRDCRCLAADKSEGALTRALNELLARRDVQLYICAAKRRYEYELTRALQARDGSAFDLERAKLDAHIAAVQGLAIDLNRSDLKPTERARLTEAAARLGVQQARDEHGLTSEQRKAQIARFTRTVDDVARKQDMPLEGPDGKHVGIA